MDNMLGEYLRKKRGDASLREFAEKCKISHTHLDSIEKGRDPRTGKRVSISTDTLKTIADGIGIDYLYLACLADNVDPRRVEGVKIPPDEQERTKSKNNVTFDDFTYAMHNEGKTLTDSDKQALLAMAKQLNEARKAKDGTDH